MELRQITAHRVGEAISKFCEIEWAEAKEEGDAELKFNNKEIEGKCHVLSFAHFPICYNYL